MGGGVVGGGGRRSVLGFLMLDTKFPRIAGDAGCAQTWEFPVLYHVVPQAAADAVVRRGAQGLLPAFVAGGRALAAAGAAAIATTCGFLVLHQTALARALSLPVMTSAILLAPRLLDELPARKKLGVLSASGADLSCAHWRAAGVEAARQGRLRVGGLTPDSYFARVLLGEGDSLDADAARQDMLAAAWRLVAQDADIGAILLECSNMPPYADDIRAATGLPVYSIIDAVNAFYAEVTDSSFR